LGRNLGEERFCSALEKGEAELAFAGGSSLLADAPLHISVPCRDGEGFA
jgi:hypothetical protein